MLGFARGSTALHCVWAWGLVTAVMVGLPGPGPSSAHAQATHDEATDGEATDGEATDGEATDDEATDDEATDDEATDDEATEREARARFERGQTAYQQGDYETALTQWQAAYELDARPLIQYNLSQAYERLGRLGEAVDALRRYLDTAEPSDPYQADARARLSSLRSRIERTGVVIANAPEGAVILIDDEEWGRTPRPDAIQVAPGSHQVRLKAAGYRDFQATVVIPAGETVTIEATMEPDQSQPAAASATSTQSGAAPTAVGADRGPPLGPWLTLGIGGAAIIAGAIAGGIALSEADQDAGPEDADNARSIARIADGLLWPGIAIAGAGLVWLLVGGQASADEPRAGQLRITPLAGPTGGGASASVRF